MSNESRWGVVVKDTVDSETVEETVEARFDSRSEARKEANLWRKMFGHTSKDCVVRDLSKVIVG